MGRRGRERQEEGAEPRETSLSTKQGAGAESALFVNVLRDSALALWVFSVLAYTGEGREAEHEVHTPVSFQHQKTIPSKLRCIKAPSPCCSQTEESLALPAPTCAGSEITRPRPLCKARTFLTKEASGRQTQHLQDKNSVHCSAALCSSGRHRPGQPPRCSHRSAELQRVKLVRTEAQRGSVTCSRSQS